MREFYEGRSVLLAGGTGFVGKTVLEKLVRSLSNVKRIYLALSPANSSVTKEFEDEILASHVFDYLRGQNPNWLEDIKRIVVPIELDLVLPQFTLRHKNPWG